MKPRKLFDKWYIEVETEEFGKVMLLDKNESFPIPVYFETKEEAENYIIENY